MTAPSVPTAVWLLGAFDPIVIAVAIVLGGKADQFGKVFIAAIVALGVSVLLAWLITLVGLPWIAPVRSDALTLFPVRFVAAMLWASAAFAARRVARR